jgi:hypothetical protein
MTSGILERDDLPTLRAVVAILGLRPYDLDAAGLRAAIDAGLPVESLSRLVARLRLTGAMREHFRQQILHGRAIAGRETLSAPDGRRASRVARLLAWIEPRERDPGLVLRLLTRRHPALGGRSALDCAVSGQTDALERWAATVIARPLQQADARSFAVGLPLRLRP